MAQLHKKRKKIEEAQLAQYLKEEEEAAALTFRPRVNGRNKGVRNLREFLRDQEEWS
jgi:hypothetical protein